MGEFSVKVTGEQVEVKLSKLRTPELIKAALHTLAQSEVAEQVPHQALPSAVLEFLDSSIQRLSDSLQAEIDALRATYCSEDEAEQALVDRREPLQVGQVKLVCEGRFWTLKAKGQPDGQFKGLSLIHI